MAKDAILWSLSDEIKLIRGLKDNYSFYALASILGMEVEEIQKKCVSLDLYTPECNNINDLSQITLTPKQNINVECVIKKQTVCYKELTEIGWTPLFINGAQSLRSPEWWTSRPSRPFVYNKENESTVAQASRPVYLLNQEKPWTMEDINLLLDILEQRPHRDSITQIMMRSVSSILQQLSIMGLVRIGADNASGEAKAWLCQEVTPRYLAKQRYYDVVPLIQHGWQVDGEQLVAPVWWRTASEINEIIIESWPPNLDVGQEQKQILALTDDTSRILDKIGIQRQAREKERQRINKLELTTANFSDPTEVSAVDQPANTPGDALPRKDITQRNGTKWYSGNYRFLFTLLEEHRAPEVIASKMDRTIGAISSRIQHVGIARYVKGTMPEEKGIVTVVTELSVDTLRSQPPFVKELLIKAGWIEEGSFLLAPEWWVKYPHPLT